MLFDCVFRSFGGVFLLVPFGRVACSRCPLSLLCVVAEILEIVFPARTLPPFEGSITIKFPLANHPTNMTLVFFKSCSRRFVVQCLVLEEVLMEDLVVV